MRQQLCFFFFWKENTLIFACTSVDSKSVRLIDSLCCGGGGGGSRCVFFPIPVQVLFRRRSVSSWSVAERRRSPRFCQKTMPSAFTCESLSLTPLTLGRRKSHRSIPPRARLTLNTHHTPPTFDYIATVVFFPDMRSTVVPLFRVRDKKKHGRGWWWGVGGWKKEASNFGSRYLVRKLFGVRSRAAHFRTSPLSLRPLPASETRTSPSLHSIDVLGVVCVFVALRRRPYSAILRTSPISRKFRAPPSASVQSRQGRLLTRSFPIHSLSPARRSCLCSRGAWTCKDSPAVDFAVLRS